MIQAHERHKRIDWQMTNRTVQNGHMVPIVVECQGRWGLWQSLNYACWPDLTPHANQSDTSELHRQAAEMATNSMLHGAAQHCKRSAALYRIGGDSCAADG